MSICSRGLAPDTVALYGMVPDGVTAVTLRGSDGSALATAPVENNTYRVSLFKAVAAGAGSLTWEGKAGSTSLGDMLKGDLSCI